MGWVTLVLTLILICINRGSILVQCDAGLVNLYHHLQPNRLGGLVSLTGVSIKSPISVISLPITRDHVSNRGHYKFPKPPTTDPTTLRPMTGPGFRNRPSSALAIDALEAVFQVRRYIVLTGMSRFLSPCVILWFDERSKYFRNKLANVTQRL